MEEEWQIVPDGYDFDPEMNRDWTLFKVNERNIESLLPRLGHLMQDVEFDLEKFRLKGLNFRVKNRKHTTILSSDAKREAKETEKYYQVSEKQRENPEHLHGKICSY